MTRREETAKGEVTSRIMSPTDDWRWIKKLTKLSKVTIAIAVAFPFFLINLGMLENLCSA